MRILFAGGGTGGHVYPALAVAKYLQRRVPDFEALFLGSHDGLESAIVPREGFSLRVVPSSGFRRLGLLGRIRFLWSLGRGLVAASGIVRRWSPDLVLATGGHASLAGGLAAVLWRRRLVVQEQNSIPGLATRLLGRMAHRIYVGFPGTERAFAAPARVRCLGNPVREELLEPHAPLAGLEPGVPVVLVLGGSRGARSLNAAVAEAIPAAAAVRRVLWLWQSGRVEHAKLAPIWSDRRDVVLRDYFSDMGAAYASATLVVCRAGAMTLAELTALGKPAILVPFPGAVDDHQTANARYLVEAGAALLLADAALSGARLWQEILSLLAAPGRVEAMAAASRALARSDATRLLAEDLVRLAGGGELRQPRSRGEAYVRTG